MASDTLDLTGMWHGTYVYPQGIEPATPFLATITESNGAFSGTIIEPDTFCDTGTIEAVLAGHRAGTSVDFTKRYVKAPNVYDNPVDYVGSISANGATISGVWSLLDLDGSFEMHRELAIEEPMSAQSAEEEPNGLVR